MVGAGIVGLSTAWHLQQWGLEVTVLERSHAGAGSSEGNAGWLSPGLVAPLPEPAVLRYGLRALLDPTSAIYVAPRLDPSLWMFLAQFVAHATQRRWSKGVGALLALGDRSLAAYDELALGGVDLEMHAAPIVAAFERASEARHMEAEIERLAAAGQRVEVTPLDAADARALAPVLSERVGAALRIDGQRYVEPGAVVSALADSVVARGGRVVAPFAAAGIRPGDRGMTVSAAGGAEPAHGDVVVVATGAWLGRLAGELGVRKQVRAGRGYSFSVDLPAHPARGAATCPVYLPAARVACTPHRGALRIGGGMEVRGVDDPLDTRRVDAIVHGARPLLSGIDWSSLRRRWVGGRPITADGLPLVGATSLGRVYVAGGHGMWGMTLGPVTGRLLAEHVATGRRPEVLAALDPLR